MTIKNSTQAELAVYTVQIYYFTIICINEIASFQAFRDQVYTNRDG